MVSTLEEAIGNITPIVEGIMNIAIFGIVFGKNKIKKPKKKGKHQEDIV